MRHLALILPFAALALLSTSVMAETRTVSLTEEGADAADATQLNASYDFFVGGFRIAELHVEAEVKEDGYDATSRVATRGILELLLKGRIASRAEGDRGDFGRLEPKGFATRYRVRSDEQTIRIGFQDTVPSRVEFVPPSESEPWEARADEQRGALDPLSAAVAALLPATEDVLCNRTIPIFDGKRRYDVIFLPPDPERFDKLAPRPEWHSTLTRCFGVYERIAGFEPEIIENEKYFPFDVWFEDTGNGVFRAVRVAGKTKLGYAIGNLRAE